ncbi:hypothetical protein KKB40_02385 [Patescibacteria group bacterium]|nr:hypothetical protein [Patescibacteria group bacterium]
MAKGKGKPTLNSEDVKLLKKTFATKSDLKLFATKSDLRKVTKGVVSEVNKLLLKQEIRTFAKMEELEEKFEKHTVKLKSDFHEEVDPILKEVLTARDERPIIVHKQEDHEDRIDLPAEAMLHALQAGVLEKIHSRGKHTFANV